MTGRSPLRWPEPRDHVVHGARLVVIERGGVLDGVVEDRQNRFGMALEAAWDELELVGCGEVHGERNFASGNGYSCCRQVPSAWNECFNRYALTDLQKLFQFEADIACRLPETREHP